MMREIIHHWWILAVRAGLALALGVAIFLLQAWAKFSILDAVTIPFLLVILSTYGILDSLAMVYLGTQFPPHAPARMLSITQGVCGMILGGMLLTVLFRPAEVEWFLYIITAQAGVTGVFEILSGLRFTSHVREEWACFAAGTASLAFAVVLQTSYHGSIEKALSWFLGYALLISCSMAWFSYRLLILNRRLQTEHGPHHPKAIASGF